MFSFWLRSSGTFVLILLLGLWSFGSSNHYRVMKLCVFSCFWFFQARRLTQDVSQGSGLSVHVAGKSLAKLSYSTFTFEARSMFFHRFLQDTCSFSFDVGLCWMLSIVVFFFFFFRVVFESLYAKFADFTLLFMAC